MGNLEQAATQSDAALATARKNAAQNPGNLANALDNAGVVALDRGELDAAFAKFKDAAAIRASAPGMAVADLARSDLNLALVEVRRRNLPAARSSLAAGLDRLKGRSDPEAAPIEAALRNVLAEVYMAEARLLEAGAELDQAARVIALAPDSSDLKPLAFSIAGNRARLARTRSDFRGADKQFLDLLKAQRATLPPSNASIAITLGNLAEIRGELGDFEKARALYLEALSILDRPGAVGSDVGILIGNMAQLSNVTGRQDEALKLALRGLGIQERSVGTGSPALGPTLSILSDIAYRSGDLAGAERYNQRERAIYDKAYGPGHPLGLSALMNAGELLRRKGDVAGATTLYARVQEIIDRSHGRESLPQVTLLAQRGELALTDGKPAIAAALYQEGLTLGVKILGTAHPRLDRLEIGLAEAELSLGDRTAARARLEHALSRVSRNIAAGGEVENKQRSLLALRYLAMLDNDAAAATAAGDGFRVAQYLGQSRTARAMAQMSARMAIGPGPLGDLLRSRQDRLSALHVVEANLVALAERAGLDGGAGEIDALRQRQHDLSQEIAATEARLRVEFPAYVELENPSPLEIADVRRLLSAKTALLSYAVTPVGVWGWAAAGNSVGYKKLAIDAAGLEQLTRNLRSGLDPSAAKDWDVLGLPARYPANDAYRLYKILVEPFAAELQGADTVYVVPSGPLVSIPFEVFLTRDPGANSFSSAEQYRNADWLVRRHAFAYLPAVSSLRALSLPGGGHGDSFLGVGDPLLADHVGAGAGSASGSGRGSGIKRSGTATASQVFDGARAVAAAIMALPSLPETATELTTMRQSFPAGDLMLREKATETLLRSRGDLGQFSVIAFATHGLVAGELRGFAEPGLVLTPPAASAGDDDGLLTASEVANLNLQADWVILSACNTAAPDGSPVAEGLSGLARAFFYAGARGLLVSHWPVASEPTVKLTTAIIADSARNGTSRALAHRRAVLDMLAGAEEIYLHPTIWAPFVVVGTAQ